MAMKRRSEESKNISQLKADYEQQIDKLRSQRNGAIAVSIGLIVFLLNSKQIAALFSTVPEEPAQTITTTKSNIAPAQQSTRIMRSPSIAPTENYVNTDDYPFPEKVWKSATGTQFHNRNNCGSMNPNKATYIDIGDAILSGSHPCDKCFPGAE